MDGSFDPSETGGGDSNVRNVEIKSESSASSILLATNNETTTTTKTKEELSTSTPTVESNSTLKHATGSSTSASNLGLFQIYQDLDEQPVVTQSPFNQGVIIDRNSHILLPSTSREDQPSPKIRFINENSLYDITKLKGSDGKYKKGSNGEIYTAKWSENENRSSVLVAIKVEEGSKTEKEGKVYCEAEKLSDLKHENIIDFYGVVSKLDSVDWVVMELGDCSLKEFLNDLRRLLSSLEDYDLRDIMPYRQCVEYFLQIVRAMKEAHSRVKKRIFSSISQEPICNFSI